MLLSRVPFWTPGSLHLTPSGVRTVRVIPYLAVDGVGCQVTHQLCIFLHHSHARVYRSRIPSTVRSYAYFGSALLLRKCSTALVVLNCFGSAPLVWQCSTTSVVLYGFGSAPLLRFCPRRHTEAGRSVRKRTGEVLIPNGMFSSSPVPRTHGAWRHTSIRGRVKPAPGAQRARWARGRFSKREHGQNHTFVCTSTCTPSPIDGRLRNIGKAAERRPSGQRSIGAWHHVGVNSSPLTHAVCMTLGTAVHDCTFCCDIEMRFRCLVRILSTRMHTPQIHTPTPRPPRLTPQSRTRARNSNAYQVLHTCPSRSATRKRSRKFSASSCLSLPFPDTAGSVEETSPPPLAVRTTDPVPAFFICCFGTKHGKKRMVY